MDDIGKSLDGLERAHLVAYGKSVHEWYEKLLSLSSVALTILVALQRMYIPIRPQQLWLLQVCWASLALCICFSLLLFWGKAQTRLDGANILRAKRVSSTDQAALEWLRETKGIYFSERPIFSWARSLQAVSFLVALVCLAAFAIINIRES